MWPTPSRSKGFPSRGSGDYAYLPLQVQDSCTGVDATCQDTVSGIQSTVLESLEALPGCLKPYVVCKLAQIRHPQPVSLTRVASQVMPLAFTVSIALWLSYICFACLILHTSKCEHRAFALYPWWIWSVFMPLAATCVLLEWMCLRYIAIPKHQILQCFRLFWIPLPFWLWLPLVTSISITQYANVIASSAFLGTVFKTAECPEAELVDRIWHEHFRQSLFAYMVPDAWTPSLRMVSILAWSLRFVKLFEIVLHVSPTPGMSAVDSQMDNDDPTQIMAEYDTCLTRLNHGSALMAIALSNGMCAISSDDLAYGDIMAIKEFNQRDDDFFARAVSHVSAQAHRGTALAFSSTLLTSTNAALQVDALAISSLVDRMTIGGHSQQILSITLAFASQVYALYESCSRLLSCIRWCFILHAVIDDYDEDDEARESAADEWCSLLWCCVVFSLGVLVFAFTVVSTMIKFAAVFTCRYATWNLTGCSDLGEILAQMDHESFFR